MFLKFSQIHSKIPILKSLFNKLQAPNRQLCWKENSTQIFPFEFRKNVKNTVFKKTGRLLLEDFVFNSLLRVGYLIRQTFIHSRCISFPIQYIKKIGHEISFSWVCKINLQRSVISRHRINH